MQGEWTGELAGPDVWATCRELIPVGSVFAFLAEHREQLFPASMFIDMYPSANGRPSMPPQVLAATVVLQSLHGLSDFETVQVLRCDLRWKAACGLGLLDTAFDDSLLTYFRRRLSRSSDPMRLFTVVKQVVAATGVLKGKMRRALDSTVLDDAVATQDTVTQIISAIWRAIREVPGAAGTAARYLSAHDYTDPGKPAIAWNDAAARADLVCRECPDRLACTGNVDGKGRHLLLMPQPLQEIQTRAGAEQQTAEWKQHYAIRAGCEATISETVHAHGLRHCRYTGLAKTHVQTRPDRCRNQHHPPEPVRPARRPSRPTRRTTHLRELCRRLAADDT